MFTGLVQDVGVVAQLSTGAMTDVWISTALGAEGFQLGESIACDGACLTVVERKAGQFKVQASAETLRRTTLGRWRVGTKVNLERALRVGDRLGGHLVLGHVDGVAPLLGRRPEGGAVVAEYALPQELSPFFIEKGSVTVDGVSLTVNSVLADRFSVSLIPETQARTNLAAKAPGDLVNLEADVIGKYVARLYGLRAGSGLSEETLRRAGFGSEGPTGA